MTLYVPLDYQLNAISSIFKQVIGVIVSQVTAVVIFNFFYDITTVQLTLTGTSDLHLLERVQIPIV